MIAARAKQLELTENISSTIPPTRLRSTEPQKIALQELEERVIPIKIVRKYPDGTYEVWTIKDFKYIIPN
jgi:DNA-directed RNA polymerase subunit K/omega